MNIWLGFLFLLIGAACGGSFGLPSKYVKKDTPWEVLWGPFFFFVTLLLPILIGPVLVKGFFSIYGSAWKLTAPVQLFGCASVSLGNAVIPVLVFGFLWGLGSMTLGMSFSFIGLSLAYSLNYGAQIACGLLVPMLLHHPEQILTAHGAVILLGMVDCLIGVVVSGRAAMLKERSLPKEPAQGDATASKQPKMLAGVIIAIVSGVLCACYAVAASFEGPVTAVATAQGNSSVAISWSQMTLILWGGAVSACGYCAILLTKNKTWRKLREPGIAVVLILAAAMALLHDGAIFFFGLGFSQLGTIGISVGYAVFMSFAIIVGNIHGFRTGEWKGASRQSVVWIAVGILILVHAVLLLGAGQAAQQAVEAAAKVVPAP